MANSSLRLYARALGLGAIAGLRSLTAPALFSYVAARDHEPDLEATPFGKLSSPPIAGTLCALALGELVVDKLPQAPNRTVPASLIWRALSGAFVGAAVCAERGGSRAAGATVGALGAVAATYGAYYLRQAVDRKSGLPDPVVALVEDAIAIGSGLGVLRS